MKVSDFKGKDVMLFFKSNQDGEFENPTVNIIDVVEGFGLYVEFSGGDKEVVAFSEITGWREDS